MKITLVEGKTNEDRGDAVIYLNPSDFLAGNKTRPSPALFTKLSMLLQGFASSTDVLSAAHRAVAKHLKADKSLSALLRTEGLTLKSLYEGTHMDEITKAVFETEEDGELPFNGELVVEGDDGEQVTLDESDIMEDVVIEAVENAVMEAIADNPNAFLSSLRDLDEALEDGDYESAMPIALRILESAGVEQTRIDEFKKGFKVSAGMRAKISRVRKKPKAGASLMGLRKRRKAAKKSSSRMKRMRYYKTNKRRIARRRQQLQHSAPIDLNAQRVVEMAAEGMRFVVVFESGSEPVFATDRPTADALASTEPATVVHITDAMLDEAKGCAKKKPMDDEADDEDDSEDDVEEACSDDEDDDEEMDDEDDEDEDETDESVSESALTEESAASLANTISKFMIAHPDVGYGELATRFKIGRDVAQQALQIASNMNRSKGNKGSWIFLAKEILGRLMAHSPGDALNPLGAKSMDRAGSGKLAASIEGGESNLSEGASTDEAATLVGKPKVRMVAGNKPGVTKVGKQSLPKVRLKGKEGAIKSAHSTAEAEESGDGGLVEFSIPAASQDRLLAIATRHGLSNDTPMTIQDGVITMQVPRDKLNALRQALTA